MYGKVCTSSTIKTTSVPQSNRCKQWLASPGQHTSPNTIKSLQVQLVSHMQYKTQTTANNEYRKQNKHTNVSKKKIAQVQLLKQHKYHNQNRCKTKRTR